MEIHTYITIRNGQDQTKCFGKKVENNFSDVKIYDKDIINKNNLVG